MNTCDSIKPLSWKQTVLAKLFPSMACEPLIIDGSKDGIITRAYIYFTWLDRFRILIFGRVTVETKTTTQNIVGECKSNSVAYPTWR